MTQKTRASTPSFTFEILRWQAKRLQLNAFVWITKATGNLSPAFTKRMSAMERGDVYSKINVVCAMVTAMPGAEKAAASRRVFDVCLRMRAGDAAIIAMTSGLHPEPSFLMLAASTNWPDVVELAAMGRLDVHTILNMATAAEASGNDNNARSLREWATVVNAEEKI